MPKEKDTSENPAVFPSFEGERWKDREGNDRHSLMAASGLSLRDYFAAVACQGLVASQATDMWTIEQVANSAYGYADAMLREREKGGK